MEGTYFSKSSEIGAASPDSIKASKSMIWIPMREVNMKLGRPAQTGPM